VQLRQSGGMPAAARERPRALRMLQRGPADPPRRSERNGVSIELPHQDVGLLSASRDIEIAVSGNAEHPRIKIQRFAVPQSAGRTAVKECCACERSSCRGPNCNVTGYQTVKWYTSSTAPQTAVRRTDVMARRAVCYSSFPQGGNGCSPPEALEETIRIHYVPYAVPRKRSRPR
jgi:hypothetical protein